MSIITSLVLPCIEISYTPEYIANAFWNQRIAQVSNITLIPYPTNTDGCLQMAYIYIGSWCDTEVAYNFLQRLKDINKESRLVHYCEEWWPVEINMNNVFMLNYSTSFPPSYYEKETYRSEPQLNLLYELILSDMEAQEAQKAQKEAEEEAMYNYAINNSQYVTFRPHQLMY